MKRREGEKGGKKGEREEGGVSHICGIVIHGEPVAREPELKLVQKGFNCERSRQQHHSTSQHGIYNHEDYNLVPRLHQ